MRNLGIIFNSFKKQGIRNFLLIVELTLGMFLMFMVLGRIEYNMKVIEKSLGVLDGNIYYVSAEYKYKEQQGGKISEGGFAPKYENEPTSTVYTLMKFYEIMQQDPKIRDKIEEIGRTCEATIFDTKQEIDGQIKCNSQQMYYKAHDKGGMNFYHYKVIKGDDFNTYYSKNPKESNINHVLIGPPFEKANPIGSIVTIPSFLDTKTKEPIKFKVIGVLDPNSPIVDGVGSRELGLAMNGYSVITDRFPFDGMTQKEVFNGVFVKLKNKNDVKVIEEELKGKIEGYSVRLINMGKMYTDIKEDTKFQIKNIILAVVMLLISSFGIISISCSTLIKREKEIGIRVAIGAKKRSIMLLLVGEIIVVYIISFCISIAFVLLKSKLISERLQEGIVVDSKVIIGSLVITLIYMIISLVPLIIRILKLNPVDLLRKS
ncbi:ABC transporter permease [Inconstantimicrobium mannanitabidum]|uniref:Uncharacterized protein n=1 Tax=Inconstantimicrobium mannanitabidum TaxID=1604901 RepID=A0ACB5RCN9_9CLOT|nr:ABC transporter permease [Clostridium sp. TW13]GKX67023.1 hypothetical protein rsdtw13_22810 [Clostridium sp. TW13]